MLVGMDRDLVAEAFTHQKALHRGGRRNRLSRRRIQTWPWGTGVEAGKTKFSWGWK